MVFLGLVQRSCCLCMFDHGRSMCLLRTRQAADLLPRSGHRLRLNRFPLHLHNHRHSRSSFHVNSALFLLLRQTSDNHHQVRSPSLDELQTQIDRRLVNRQYSSWPDRWHVEYSTNVSLGCELRRLVVDLRFTDEVRSRLLLDSFRFTLPDATLCSLSCV